MYSKKSGRSAHAARSVLCQLDEEEESYDRFVFPSRQIISMMTQNSQTQNSITMMFRPLVLSKLRSQLIKISSIEPNHLSRLFSAVVNDQIVQRIEVSQTSNAGKSESSITNSETAAANEERVKMSACGDLDDDFDDDDEELEEMFVEAHESFGHKLLEWGGPRRGGRLLEPTRFGDWERKGRCTDF